MGGFFFKKKGKCAMRKEGEGGCALKKGVGIDFGDSAEKRQN